MSIEKKTKILQFGEGNFLRCFVDWMVDIMNEKADFGAAVQIVQPIGARRRRSSTRAADATTRSCAASRTASPWSCSARSRA